MEDAFLKQKLQVLELMVTEGFKEICKLYPHIRKMGGTLFLGKYYARPDGKILMLGINPGIIPGRLILNTKLQSDNLLLQNPLLETEIKYWKNARILFNTTESLKSKLDKATFSFCCPYRTEEWKGPEIPILLRYSSPILNQMIIDCEPEYIILSGVKSLELIQSSYLLKPSLKVISGSQAFYYDSIYQWQRVDTRWNNLEISLLQIPHFSRAHGVQRLKQCGLWLEQQIKR